MRQLQPVLWTKGLLLTPQHLQTQDRFLEDVLAFQMSALTFCPWGFHRLTVDREALAGGALALVAASGLFPDGLSFDIPGADAAPEPKPLDACWQPDQEALHVYLAIPEYRYGGFNVAAAHDAQTTRYHADVLLRRDENTGLLEKPIIVARKNFRLLAETESLQGANALCIARVTRSATGAYQLDPRFVPPLIDIAASEYVLAIARRLVEVLSAKSTQLSERRRQRNQGLAEFGVTDVANFWLLYTVNTFMPQLRHLYETRRGHPIELYSAMLALSGAVTTFSPTLHPRDLPLYDHTDLGKSFTDLDEKLRLLLETVVPANHVSLAMRAERASIYAAAIDQDAYLGAPHWFLAVGSEKPPAELARDVPKLVKMSSGDRVDNLIKRALPGLELAHVPHPPSAVPVKLGYQYFRVAQSGPDWQAITRARNVAAYVPSDFTNPQVELLIVLPVKD